MDMVEGENDRIFTLVHFICIMLATGNYGIDCLSFYLANPVAVSNYRIYGQRCVGFSGRDYYAAFANSGAEKMLSCWKNCRSLTIPGLVELHQYLAASELPEVPLSLHFQVHEIAFPTLWK